MRLFTLSLIAAFTVCIAGQDKNQDTKPAEKPTVAQGEFVAELDKAIWHVFQARNGDYWFGSPERGAYRYNGKTLVNFTTKDGLGHNGIGGIQEDKRGNIYFTTSGEGGTRISKFDGKSFSTLTVSEGNSNSDWKLQPDDLWFSDASDTGAVFRYDGKLLNRLTMPKTREGEDHVARHPRSLYPNAKYSPYDVFRIFKDSKGHILFGTALLGACRYDGKSFLWILEADVRNGSGGTRSIVEDKDGKFWFSNTLQRFDVNTKDAAGQSYRKEKGMGDASDRNRQHYSHFMSGTLDNSGAMWMATLGSGVWRCDGEKVTHYPVKNGDKPVSLLSIYRDNKGVMWLGTHAEGAYRFNGKGFEKFRP